MKIDLLSPSAMFSVAELSAMTLDFELFRFLDIYAAFYTLDTSQTRARYLVLKGNKRARAKTATADWVANGGDLPEVLDLIDNR